jgi:ABC-type uncharacterized transport system substrate-binding protein
MDRRTFISSVTLGLLAAPLAAGAQQEGKVYRVGVLAFGPRPSLAPLDSLLNLLQRLRELGYVEGQNLRVEWQSADNRTDRLPQLAAELVRLRVDVIVVPSTQPALAAKQATTTIPIVMTAASDPVETGLISSLAKPGGNVTGLTVSGGEISGKRLELLREMVPKVSLVAVLADPTNASHATFWRETQVAARTLRVRVERVDAQVPKDIEGAFVAIGKLQAGALVVFPEPMLYAERRRIEDLAAKNGLASMFGHRGFVEAGGLMSYAPSYPDLGRRGASYVDKILKGAKPADLPVEQPTKFELVINLKTAKALGLTIPQALLQRADQVIE